MSVDLLPLYPEVFVSGLACAILVLDLYLPEERRAVSYFLSLVALIGGALLAAAHFGDTSRAFDGMVVSDPFADLIKIAVCLASTFVFAYSRDYTTQRGFFKGEYFVLGLFSVVGMMIIASANHFLVLYLGLELMSLCLYAMVAFQRDSTLATEAAMKYFVLGALGSAMLLYGMSILYGLTGSLAIETVRAAVSQQPVDDLALILGLIFILVSLAFKLGTVPFHMWVPDVYHGAPTTSTLFVSTGPKLAGLAMIMRLLVGGLEDLHAVWQDMLIVLAVLSMGVGNLIAIAQTNFKRMLAYSAISHMGFMLLGVIPGTATGYSAALFYGLMYLLMSLGGFGIIVLLSRAGFESDELQDLKGLNGHSPWHAFLVLLLMISMAGIPPSVGFFAKLSVIQAVVDVDLIWLAVVAVLFAVVGAYYYLRVIKLVYFDAPEQEASSVQPARELRVLLGLNACATVFLLPFIGPIQDLCIRAAQSLPG